MPLFSATEQSHVPLRCSTNDPSRRNRNRSVPVASPVIPPENVAVSVTVTNVFAPAVLTVVGTCDATVYVVVNVSGGVADARAAKTAAATDDAESATTTEMPHGIPPL
jgi:hypothetical protein